MFFIASSACARGALRSAGLLAKWVQNLAVDGSHRVLASTNGARLLLAVESQSGGVPVLLARKSALGLISLKLG